MNRMESATLIVKKKPTDKKMNENIIFGTDLGLISSQMQRSLYISEPEWIVNCIHDFIKAIQLFH